MISSRSSVSDNIQILFFSEGEKLVFLKLCQSKKFQVKSACSCHLVFSKCYSNSFFNHRSLTEFTLQFLLISAGQSRCSRFLMALQQVSL